MAVEDRYYWKNQAVCRNGDMDALFVSAVEQRQVRKICYECPVRLQCLIEALQTCSEYGIWGGLTERERRSIKRAYPHVTSWADWVRFSNEPLAEEVRANRIPHIQAIIKATQTIDLLQARAMAA